MSAGAEFAEISGHVRAYQRSRALTVVADLGIADLLAGGPRNATALAAATNTSPEALYRVLRALASIGVFSEDAEQRFSLTPLGEYLRRDHPLSVDPLCRMLGSDHEWRMWGELRHCVATGEVASIPTLGMDSWEYRRRNPEQNRIFDAAMHTIARMLIPPVLDSYDFSQHSTIADIGGGTGALLTAILARCPNSTGLLFDQPHVVAQAAPVLEQAGMTERVTVIGGDFFESVPGGADAYVLSHILHDWSDREAEAILGAVRVALHPESRLILLDAVVGPPNTDPVVKFLDLQMLVSLGGKERTAQEWHTLLSLTGFTLQSAIRAGPSIDIIAAIPT